MLTQEENVAGLAAINRELIAKGEAFDSPQRVVLDAEAIVEDGRAAGWLVKHAPYYWLLLAESHLTQRLFAAMVRRIELLPRQRDR